MYQSWAFGDAEYCSFKKVFLVDSVSSLFSPPPVPNPHRMHLYAKYKVCLFGLQLLKQTMLEVGVIGELDKGMKWHCRQENMHISPRIMLRPGIVGDVIWMSSKV